MTYDRATDPASLFATDAAARAAEDGLDVAVSAMIDEFLRAPHVTTPADLAALTRRFSDSAIPDRRVEPMSYFAGVVEPVVAHSNRVSSPRCLAHMNQGTPYFVRPLARLLAAMNQNLTKADASRVLTLCERQTLAMMHELVFGLPEDFYGGRAQERESTLGVVTSGGTLANLTALWCARNAAFGPRGDFGGVEREGLVEALRHYGHRDAVVIGPESMHYSFNKATGLLGLGERGLVRVPIDARGRTDLAALRYTVDACRVRGSKILAVVGVAGSTDAGAVDPLPEMAEIARRAGAHFHVDAAWGGPMLLSPTHRGLLRGIERADSVTLDAHKQMYLPLGIGMLLLRDPDAARAIEKHTRYLSRPGSADLGRRSLEGSRPGSILHLHAALHILGRQGYAALIDEGVRKARRLAAMIGDTPEFELLAEPDSNIVLYRCVPAAWRQRLASGAASQRDLEALNRFNERLHKAQRQAGRTYVSRTTLLHTRYGRDVSIVALRAVVANPRTTEVDLAAVLDDQRNIAAALTMTAESRIRPPAVGAAEALAGGLV
jgi:glutamate decarboxylase